MKKSKKHEKLKNIWSKIKKPLFICSFILNILFISIAIVGCISSSNNDDHNKTNNSSRNNIQYRQTLNQNDSYYYLTDLNDTTWHFNDIVDRELLSPSGLANYLSDDDVVNAYLQRGDVRYEVNTIIFKYSNHFDVDIVTPHFDIYYLNESSSIYVNAQLDIGAGWYQLNHDESTPVKILNNFYIDFVTPYVVSSSVGEAFYSSLFASAYTAQYGDLVNATDIYLGDDFVPSVYVAYNGDLIFNGFGARMQSATTFFLDLNGFTFISNGQTFNQVRIAYMPLPAGAPYITDDGTIGISTEDYTDYVYCLGVFYQYVDENDVIIDSVRVVTNRRKLVIADNANINAYDVRPPFMVWVNQNYRSIKVIEDTGLIIQNEYLQYTNMSAVQLLQVTSNVTQNVAGMTNVFDMIRHSFESLQGILQMSIFPGVTIGLLLFIPLILTIIMVVIRLVKR